MFANFFLSDIWDFLASTNKLCAIIIARDFNVHVDDLSDNTAKDFLCILQSFCHSQRMQTEGKLHR